MAQSGAPAHILLSMPDALAAAIEQHRGAERVLRETVRDMYLAGFTWAELGRMLGVTRQAARQRFGSEVEAWRAGAGDAMPWDGWEDDAWVQAVEGMTE